MRYSVYLINLDADTERLDFVDNQLRIMNIAYERFSAIRGDDLPDWLIPYFYRANGTLSSTMSRGEIGCYASHLALMRRVVGSGVPALILEDDITIAPEFTDVLDAALALPLQWDIIRLSSPGKRRWVIESLRHGYDLIRYRKAPVLTGAYFIRPSGAKRFLTFKGPRIRQVDLDLRRDWEFGILTMGIHPTPISQNAIGSTIMANGGRTVVSHPTGLSYYRDSARRMVHNLRQSVRLRRASTAT